MVAVEEDAAMNSRIPLLQQAPLAYLWTDMKCCGAGPRPDSVDCLCTTGGATELPGRTNSIRLRAGSGDNRTARAGCGGCSADGGHYSRSLIILLGLRHNYSPPDRSQLRDESPRARRVQTGIYIMSDTAVQT